MASVWGTIQSIEELGNPFFPIHLLEAYTDTWYLISLRRQLSDMVFCEVEISTSSYSQYGLLHRFQRVLNKNCGKSLPSIGHPPAIVSAARSIKLQKYIIESSHIILGIVI